MITKKLLTAFLFLLFYYQNTKAQTYEKKIDSLILTGFGNQNEPGGAFLVSKMGRPFIAKLLEKPIWSWMPT